jgi:hypothetical protein
MTDYLIDQGLIARQQETWILQASVRDIEHGIPQSLQQMIEQQFDEHEAHDRRILEVASVVGTEFSAAAVASGLEEGEEPIEEGCATLARYGHFIRFRDYQEWPDGSVTGRYNFVQALYQ